MRFSRFLTLGLLLWGGCEFSLSDVPVSDESAFQGQDSGMLLDADVVDDAGRGREVPPKDEAGIAHDGGPDGTSPGPAQHGSCTQSAPADLPFVSVPSDARGRPLFDLFRDHACTDEGVESYPTCQSYDANSAWQCSACFGAGSADSALCVNRDARAPGCLMLTSLDGSCSACVSAQGKAKACCAGLDVDCRPWPFDGSSGPGQLCAGHADCSPGLVCKADGMEGARCTCPEDLARVQGDPSSCSPLRVP